MNGADPDVFINIFVVEVNRKFYVKNVIVNAPREVEQERQQTEKREATFGRRGILLVVGRVGLDNISLQWLTVKLIAEAV